MALEGTAETAMRWWRTRKARVIGAALAAVTAAFVVGYALIPQPETFRTAPDLIARLGELGAPCLDYTSLADDDRFGMCAVRGDRFTVGTDPDDAARNLPEWPSVLAKSKENKAVAVGKGWYVYGDRTYVARVAELLGGDLIS